MGIVAPLKFFGGKNYLASWFHSLAPTHIHRVHAYAGGLGEFWNWPADNVSEVVNDLDGRLTNFYRVLADQELFAEFIRRTSASVFCEELWRSCRDYFCREVGLSFDRPDVEAAWRFFILVRQSFAGQGKTFAPLTRNRLRRGMNEQVSAWMNVVDGLPEVHARLRRVVILNRPALEVIAQQDGENSFFLLDPPYLSSTRSATDVYEHEMTEADHHDLIDLLLTVRGKVMLCGYANPLYDERLRGWKKRDHETPNHTAKADRKRIMIERVWLNYTPTSPA